MFREKALDSNKLTRSYFDQFYIEMRHIDAQKPDTSFTLYGHKFSTPVMTAALSHLKGMNNQGDGMVQIAEGAFQAQAINWVGMSSNRQYQEISNTGASTIRIIKPYADEKLVLSQIKQAENLNALAVGMDLDHAFNANGNYDCVLGHPMRPRTFKEIKDYCRMTHLPFIVKGVLSIEDAKKCLDAGVQGIVISHHHGILPSAVPPLMILPQIAQVINGNIPIFIDCCFMNGTDVFKALALGASAVNIGRPVMAAVSENGSTGVSCLLNSITSELAGIMARTCSHKLSDITSSLLWKNNGVQFNPAAFS